MKRNYDDRLKSGSRAGRAVLAFVVGDQIQNKLTRRVKDPSNKRPQK